MKKWMIGAAFVLAALGVQAQTLIVEAGLNAANWKHEDVDQIFDQDYQSQLGLNLSAYVPLNILPVVDFSLGLNFSQEGFKSVQEAPDEKVIETVRVNYLRIPAQFTYGLKLTDKLGLDFSLMPSLGFALSGDYTEETKPTNGPDETESRDLVFGDNPTTDDLKTMDFGCDLGVWIRMDRLAFGLGYQLGFTNIAADQSDQTVVKNKNFNFGLRYYIGSL